MQITEDQNYRIDPFTMCQSNTKKLIGSKNMVNVIRGAILVQQKKLRKHLEWSGVGILSKHIRFHLAHKHQKLTAGIITQIFLMILVNSP